jgi:hypothetical protein
MVHHASGVLFIVLSLVALLTVISGFFQPPQTDEGTGAHIFQLAIVLSAPALLVLLATGDWKRPGRIARLLAIPFAALALAFGALYYLEHFR